MSCNYAEGLSYYEHKGKLGLPEKFDTPEEVKEKVKILIEWLQNSKHTVVHTGAGVSTSAGIPDFRGPNGVWTLEEQGKKPSINISWNDAKPTPTHMALVALQRAGFVEYVISQNIDGLHLKSGFPRKHLAELHGNMFTDKCAMCHRQFVRPKAATTVGQKSEGVRCPGTRRNGMKCRGRLYDTILDWEHDLPAADLQLSDIHSCAADVSLCLGTTLQIIPSGNLPVHTKKRGGKLVICNLQQTKQDRHADLIIHSYVDDVMQEVLEQLQVPPILYTEEKDPSKIISESLRELNFDVLQPFNENLLWPQNYKPGDWTVLDKWVNDKELSSKAKLKKVKKTKKVKDIDRNVETPTSIKRIIPDTSRQNLADKKAKLESCGSASVMRKTDELIINGAKVLADEFDLSDEKKIVLKSDNHRGTQVLQSTKQEVAVKQELASVNGEDQSIKYEVK